MNELYFDGINLELEWFQWWIMPYWMNHNQTWVPYAWCLKPIHEHELLKLIRNMSQGLEVNKSPSFKVTLKYMATLMQWLSGERDE